MTRDLKRLGLAFAAILAIAGVAASAAQAESEFTATQYPATIEATQAKGKTVDISFPNFKVTCTSAGFQGIIGTKTLQWTQKLTRYNGCTAVIGGKKTIVDIEMNGCDWHAKDVTAKANKTLMCPSGKEVQLIVYESEAAEKEGKSLCTVDMPAQSELGSITYENIAGSPEDVVAKENLKGISYTITGSFLICGSGGSSAEYVTETTLTAKNESGAAIGFMVG
jgi:hypothetical protein